jgi:hypothetical protein
MSGETQAFAEADRQALRLLRAMEFDMDARIAMARELVKSSSLTPPEKSTRLNQLTADGRREFDQRIAQIRVRIAGLGITAAGAIWRTIRGIVVQRPFNQAQNIREIAQLRIQLAEVHAAKFAMLAEMKIIRTLV